VMPVPDCLDVHGPLHVMPSDPILRRPGAAFRDAHLNQPTNET
jgi:hypothetical protein